PGVAAQRVGDLQEPRARDPAHALDELGRVTREVALEHLEDAHRMLELHVDLGRLALLELHAVRAVRLVAGDIAHLLLLTGGELAGRAAVAPGLDLVGAVLLVPAGEESVELLRVAELVLEDHRRVREVLDVLAELRAGAEDVVDDRAEEGDVRAVADR